jgi:hypothetical protein
VLFGSPVKPESYINGLGKIEIPTEISTGFPQSRKRSLEKTNSERQWQRVLRSDPVPRSEIKKRKGSPVLRLRYWRGRERFV